MLLRLRVFDAVVAWTLNIAFPLMAGLALGLSAPRSASGWVVSGALRLSAVALLVVWLVFVRRLRWDDLKQAFLSTRRSIGVGALVGLSYFAATYLVVVAINFIDRAPNLVDGTWNPWVATLSLAEVSMAFVLVFGVVGPMVEEFVHRGVAYHGLRSRLQITTAALIASLVFALGHEWEWDDMVSAFAFSMIAIWLVKRYESLTPAIAAHITGNLAVVITGWSLYNLFGVPGSNIG